MSTEMVSLGWSHKPAPLRQGLLLVLALLGPLWLLFGRLQEIRVLYEAWYLIYLLALPAFFNTLRAPRRPDPQVAVQGHDGAQAALP